MHREQDSYNSCSSKSNANNGTWYPNYKMALRYQHRTYSMKNLNLVDFIVQNDGLSRGLARQGWQPGEIDSEKSRAHSKHG